MPFIVHKSFIYIVIKQYVCYDFHNIKSGQGSVEPKRSQLIQHLDDVEYTLVEISDNALDIAEQLVSMKILSAKCYDDCQHIAAAVECGCDCIVSWNFKHIVNIRTIRGVRAITNLKGYKPIEILNPSVLLESEE